MKHLIFNSVGVVMPNLASSYVIKNILLLCNNYSTIKKNILTYSIQVSQLIRKQNVPVSHFFLSFGNYVEATIS